MSQKTSKQEKTIKYGISLRKTEIARIKSFKDNSLTKGIRLLMDAGGLIESLGDGDVKKGLKRLERVVVQVNRTRSKRIDAELKAEQLRIQGSGDTLGDLVMKRLSELDLGE